MWKSLYQTFVTYPTFFFFLGLYSWMSSSQKWWYQSSKYGNDWHLVNCSCAFLTRTFSMFQRSLKDNMCFFWCRCPPQTNFQHQINHFPFQQSGRYLLFPKLVLRMISGFIHPSRYVCSKMFHSVKWWPCFELHINCKYGWASNTSQVLAQKL